MAHRGPGLVLSIHLVEESCLQLQFRGSDALFWMPGALHCKVHMYSPSKHSYTINYYSLKEKETKYQ